MAEEELVKEELDVEKLDDCCNYNFKTNVNAFLGLFSASKPRVTNTLRPPIKAMAMHVASCIAGKNNGEPLNPPCQAEFTARPLDWTKVDAGVINAIEAAGNVSPSIKRWTAEQQQLVKDYMKDHTFVSDEGFNRLLGA
jgi:hypothetical protein